MFDTKNVFEIISSQIVLLQKHYETSSIDTRDMVSVSNVENQLTALRDKVYSKYADGGLWANEGYQTSKSAIIHETHKGRSDITKAIERGKLLCRYDSLSNALNDNLITSDHLDLFSRINDSKYAEHLDESINLLVENAIKIDVLHFSQVINYWKNIVDDQINEPSDDCKNFENRRLFVNELDDNTYLVHGILDKATAIVFKKALEDIANKLWRKDSVEQRSTTSHSAYRADAAGYLGQMYVTSSAKGLDGFAEFNITPSISTDIVIDVAELRKDFSTREYLTKNLTKTSPIHNAHSKNFIKQILCDAELTVVVKNSDSTIELGRKVRIAPEKMKRILATQTHNCTIEGCSIPASWCDAHHIHHWVDGGETKIENLVLLCRRHHNMIHNDERFMYKASQQITDFKNRHHPPPLKNTG